MSIYEEKTELIGWGLYHKFVIGIACACAFSQSMALMSIPFAVPVAGCDIPMSESMILTINLCLYLGMAIGGFFLSSAADSSGRKCMIPTTLVLIFGSNFACGFSHGAVMIAACAFMLGSGIAGNTIIVKIHLAEVLHIKNRGYFLVFPDLFWTLGYTTSAISHWLATPAVISGSAAEMRLATWRLMFGLSSCLSIMVACASALIHPSPRYLLYSRRYAEALDTLKHMYTINNSKHHETFQIKEDDILNTIEEFHIIDEMQPDTCLEQVVVTLKHLKMRTFLLLSRFFTTSLILTCVKLPSLFGILIVNIWLSKMLNIGEERNCTITGINVSHIEVNEVNKCTLSTQGRLYRDFFLVGFGIFFGQLILLCVIERFGRCIPLMCGYFVCGISSMSLAYVFTPYSMRLIISSIFMAAYSLVQSTFNVMLVELYPTAIRGSAAGHIQFLSNVLCGFIIKYLQSPCQNSFIVMGCLMLAAAAIAFFLPDVCNRPMIE